VIRARAFADGTNPRGLPKVGGGNLHSLRSSWRQWVGGLACTEAPIANRQLFRLIFRSFFALDLPAMFCPLSIAGM
jgi:hypothetical protein